MTMIMQAAMRMTTTMTTATAKLMLTMTATTVRTMTMGGWVRGRVDGWGMYAFQLINRIEHEVIKIKEAKEKGLPIPKRKFTLNKTKSPPKPSPMPPVVLKLRQIVDKPKKIRTV